MIGERGEGKPVREIHRREREGGEREKGRKRDGEKEREREKVRKRI